MIAVIVLVIIIVGAIYSAQKGERSRRQSFVRNVILEDRKKASAAELMRLHETDPDFDVEQFLQRVESAPIKTGPAGTVGA